MVRVCRYTCVRLNQEDRAVAGASSRVYFCHNLHPTSAVQLPEKGMCVCLHVCVRGGKETPYWM